MRQILDVYSFKVNRAGFIPCPFHAEKTPSLKAYSNSFHCFGCGKGGDVIRFVMEMEHCDFQAACHRIDEMFCLKLYEKPTLTQHRKNQQAQKRIKAEKEAREQAKQYECYVYRCIAAYRSWLRKQPQTPEVQHDYDFLERLTLQFIRNNNINSYNIRALLAAIRTKHRKHGEETWK